MEMIIMDYNQSELGKMSKRDIARLRIRLQNDLF